MNTANLQLEGLYVAVTALAEALREKGVLSAEELARSFDRAEAVAWEAASEKDISPANIEAIIFPIRYLKVAVESSARGRHMPFHEVARIVGETKESRPPGTTIRRDDEPGAGGGQMRGGAHRLSEAEMLEMARRQEEERDA